MDIKIGLSSSICFFDIERAFYWVWKFKLLDGIEILPFRWQHDKITRLAKKYPKVEILGFHAPFCKEYSDFIRTAIGGLDTAGGIFNLIWAILLGPVKSNPAAKLAKEFGAYVNFHPNSFTPIKGCRLFLENPTDKEEGYRPEYVRAMTDRHSVGATFDTSHAAEISRTPSEFLMAYEEMDPEIIHLSDSTLGKTQQHLIPGQGNLPLKELLWRFKRKADNCPEKQLYIILELAPAFNREKQKTAIKESLDFIKNALE